MRLQTKIKKGVYFRTFIFKNSKTTIPDNDDNYDYNDKYDDLNSNFIYVIYD